MYGVIPIVIFDVNIYFNIISSYNKHFYRFWGDCFEQPKKKRKCSCKIYLFKLLGQKYIPNRERLILSQTEKTKTEYTKTCLELCCFNIIFSLRTSGQHILGKNFTVFRQTTRFSKRWNHIHLISSSNRICCEIRCFFPC